MRCSGQFKTLTDRLDEERGGKDRPDYLAKGLELE